MLHSLRTLPLRVRVVNLLWFVRYKLRFFRGDANLWSSDYENSRCWSETAMEGIDMKVSGMSVLYRSNNDRVLPGMIAAVLAGVICAGPSSVVMAQDATPAASNELQEVVVTATRREESLSKVAVSVSAFTAEKMDVIGVKSIADVARFTPGLSFGANQTNDISIRGISSNAGAGTTGIYIDDTPIQIRSLGGFNNDDALPAIFDLERVEVLRGPQGTLFGAGSEGGTVRYITPQPSLTKYSSYGRAEVSFTKYGQANYEGGIAGGGPIIDDKLGFRASAWYRGDGGWIDRKDSSTGDIVERNTNHIGTFQLRLAASWAPTSNILVTPAILYQNRKSHDVSTYNATVSDPGNGTFISTNPDPRRQPDEFYLPTLKVDVDMGAVRLISNTSYFHRVELSGYEGTIYNLSFYQNFPDILGVPFSDPNAYPLLTSNGPRLPAGLENYHSPARVTNKQENITQEFRLQSNDPDSRFNWTGGLFLSLNRQQSTEEIMDPMEAQLFQAIFGLSDIDVYGLDPTRPSLYGPNQDSYINNLVSHDRQYALFGEGSFAVTDRLKLTAGARYSKTSFDFIGHSDGAQNGGPLDSAGNQSEKPFTPKLGLSFQYDPQNLYYATWAKGFRVGGANPPLPGNAGCTFPSSGAYSSDSLKSFEVGAKNRIADRVRLASSAYYIKWSNIQQSFVDPGCQISSIKNLGEATVKGFDVQADVLITDNWKAETSIGFTQARYKGLSTLTDFQDGNPPVKNVYTTEGDTVGGSPWTVAVGTEYSFSAFGQPWYARLDYEYSSRNNRPTPPQNPLNDASSDPYAFRLPKTEFVSFRAGFTYNDWNIAGFIDNLFNKQTVTQYLHSQAGLDPTDASVIQFDQGGFRPRTIGLTVTYRH